MAVGTVSGIDPQDNWQLITSTTITSGQTSQTYSSLSGYKHLLLTARSVIGTAGELIAVRPNNDTSSGNYVLNGTGRMSYFQFAYYFDGSTATAGAFEIKNIDKALPHEVWYSSANTNAAQGKQYWVKPEVITSLNLSATGGSWTSGTIELYGIPA